MSVKKWILEHIDDAKALVGLIPQSPGIVDDVARNALRLLLEALGRALRAGYTPEELIARLDELGPAERLDLQDEVDKFLEKKSEEE